MERWESRAPSFFHSERELWVRLGGDECWGEAVLELHNCVPGGFAKWGQGGGESDEGSYQMAAVADVPEEISRERAAVASDWSMLGAL